MTPNPSTSVRLKYDAYRESIGPICVILKYDAYRESICVILKYDAYRESICVRLKYDAYRESICARLKYENEMNRALGHLCANTGRFATGKVRHRKVRHSFGRFATALEGSSQMS